MRLLRALAGTVLWLVAAVLGLVGSILCVTIILLPVGLAVLGYARRLFSVSTKLMAPRTAGRASQASEKTKRVLGARRKDKKGKSKR